MKPIGFEIFPGLTVKAADDGLVLESVAHAGDDRSFTTVVSLTRDAVNSLLEAIRALGFGAPAQSEQLELPIPEAPIPEKTRANMEEMLSSAAAAASNAMARGAKMVADCAAKAQPFALAPEPPSFIADPLSLGDPFDAIPDQAVPTPRDGTLERWMEEVSERLDKHVQHIDALKGRADSIEFHICEQEKSINALMARAPRSIAHAAYDELDARVVAQAQNLDALSDKLKEIDSQLSRAYALDQDLGGSVREAVAELDRVSADLADIASRLDKIESRPYIVGVDPGSGDDRTVALAPGPALYRRLKNQELACAQEASVEGVQEGGVQGGVRSGFGHPQKAAWSPATVGWVLRMAGRFSSFTIVRADADHWVYGGGEYEAVPMRVWDRDKEGQLLHVDDTWLEDVAYGSLRTDREAMP